VGVGLGLLLLTAFVVAGRGLGASGAFGRVAATGVAAVAPEHAAERVPLAGYLGDGSSPPLADWLVVEMVGVLIGGLASALLARRFRPGIIRGEGVGPGSRLALACGGGVAMGVGAMLARGCTSGLALTGGALLAPGAWIFIASAFGFGYLFAPLVRRSWA
jgi:hypothetical protein